MAIAAPWALVGLLALPILLWLDRRRRRAVAIDVPSLLFFAAADDADTASRRPRLDADLLLALAAATLLTLSAAGPSFRTGGSGRSVRVVVDAGPAMAARSSDGTTASSRAEAAVEAIRAALGPDDDFARAERTGADGRSSASLADVARGGAASLRVLVTDRARPDVSAEGVIVVAVGDPAVSDAGIASADVEAPPPPTTTTTSAGPRRVFVNVRNDGPVERRLAVRVEGGAATSVAIPPFGAASATLDAAPAGASSSPIVVRLDDAGGALTLGDEVLLQPASVAVHIASPADGLPARYGALLRTTLAVVAPGFSEVPTDRATVRFVAATPGAGADARGGLTIALHPIAPGAASARAPDEGPFEAVPPEFGRDVDPAGCELRYAPSAFRGRPPGKPWPIVRRLGPDAVEWLPDPLAGSPAPADHPMWPIFVENAVAFAAGDAGLSGYRARGVLDPEAMTLGRDRIPWDPRFISAAPISRRPVERSLSPLLCVLAIVSLVALWLRGARSAVRAGTVGA